MGKKDFEPVEENVQVNCLLPDFLVADLQKEAIEKNITVSELLRRAVSLLILHSNYLAEDSIETPTTTDSFSRGLQELIRQERTLVGFEFHDFKATDHGTMRTKPISITMPDKMKLEMDATAMGLGLGSTQDFIVYAGLFHRHLRDFMKNPPPIEP